MKNIMPCVLWLSLIMFPLTASCGSLSIEEDPHDPKLHGQVVRFNVPVVYMELTEEDSKKYDQKSIDIGLILLEKESATRNYNRFDTHSTKEIPSDISFTINSSYWVRNDWFTREFAPDYKIIVLEDENGTISTCLLSVLFYSDRRDLLNE